MPPNAISDKSPAQPMPVSTRVAMHVVAPQSMPAQIFNEEKDYLFHAFPPSRFLFHGSFGFTHPRILFATLDSI